MRVTIWDLDYYYAENKRNCYNTEAMRISSYHQQMGDQVNFVRNEFEQLFEVFRLELLLVVMGIVLASGMIICLLSTWLVVNKLVSLNKDELYY